MSLTNSKFDKLGPLHNYVFLICHLYAHKKLSKLYQELALWCLLWWCHDIERSDSQLNDIHNNDTQHSAVYKTINLRQNSRLNIMMGVFIMAILLSVIQLNVVAQFSSFIKILFAHLYLVLATAVFKPSNLGSLFNGTARIRHQCRKTAVFSCHRFLITSGVLKMNKI
jgi:hypothetical protein